jgi:hypothetical protein
MIFKDLKVLKQHICILYIVSGSNTLYNDFEFVLGHKLNPFWKVIWIITPVLLIVSKLLILFLATSHFTTFYQTKARFSILLFYIFI